MLVDLQGARESVETRESGSRAQHKERFVEEIRTLGYTIR